MSQGTTLGQVLDPIVDRDYDKGIESKHAGFTETHEVINMEDESISKMI